MPSTLTDPAYRAFVEHLVALRKAKGVTGQDLAQRLGKWPAYVSKTERYERRLDPAEFRAWVLALGGDPAKEFAAVAAGLADR